MARPNIIVFVTDDQGYGDLGCHGNPHIRTPNMDHLHSQSVRFTNFHVDPTCSPSRAALMTGCYSHRVNVWHTIMGRNYMDATRPTMPELFRDAGYRTGHFGKWHLGGHAPYSPTDRGFLDWLGQGDGGTGCMTDHWGNRRVDDIYIHNGRERRIPGYGPDVFFDAAMSYIAEPDDRPFFIYLATYIPHNPTSVPDTRWADPYRESVPLETAYFYSSIERADHNLGRLRARLQELGIADNTIILFMTDNGTAQGHHVYNAGMRGNKGSVYDGGHRVPCFLHWPAAGLDNGRDIDGLTGHIDLLPTLLDLALDPRSATQPQEIDGTSLARSLRNPGAAVPDRTIVVESQRVRHPQKYRDFAVMRGHWRLVNGSSLYNVEDDPGQQDDRSTDHPQLMAELREAYETYWDDVTPGDERFGRPVIGAPPPNGASLPTEPSGRVVLCTEHLFPDEEGVSAWNQQHVLTGVRVNGGWPVRVATPGRYRFEFRRWPQEVDAPIAGLPGDEYEDAGAAARNPAFLWDEEVGDTLYGLTGDAEAMALPVASIRVQVGGNVLTLDVDDGATSVVTDVPLPSGDQWLRAEMLNADGTVIGSVYYVTVSPSPATE